MRRKRLIGLLVLFTLRSTFAADVSFGFDTSDTTPQGLRSVSLYPSGTFTNGAGRIITRDRMSRITDSDGNVTISNVYGGDYRGELQGTFTVTTNWYHFPVTNGLISAADWITAPTNGNTGYRAYTTAESDGRYLARAGDSGSTLTNLNPANVSAGLFPNNYEFESSVQFDGGVNFTNGLIVMGGTITGNGAGVTNVLDRVATNDSRAVSLSGPVTTSGRFTNSAAVISAAQTNSGNIQSATINATGQFNGSGAGLTAVPGSSITPQSDVAKFFPQLGNAFNDVDTATSTGPQIGFALEGPTETLWYSSATGTGTNVWGMPVYVPGGITSLGNPVWKDIPKAPFQSQGFYFGYGPQNSSSNTVYASGHLGIGSAVQPYAYVVNANPYGGGAGMQIRSGFTNSIHGFLAGNDREGTPIYVSQFGMSLLQLSDGYFPNGTALGHESQQSPSYQCPLLDDPNMNLFVSINGQRAGDTYLGQIPLQCIDLVRFGPTHALWRLPLQHSNVWMPETNNLNAAGAPFVVNSGWEDAFVVDELTGGTTNIGQHISGFLHIGKANGPLDPAGNGGFQCETNAYFNMSPNSVAKGGWIAWDYNGSARLGVWCKFGQFPMFVAGSGSPLMLGHSSTADLRSDPDANSEVAELQIDSTGNTRAKSLTSTNGFINVSGTTLVTWTAGSGSPVGVVSAPVGSMYSRIDGGSGTSLYVKESGGTGNTGWVGK